MLKGNIKLNLGPFNQFRKQTTADLKGTGSGPIADAIQHRWAYRYLEYSRKKYRENAAGGGDWPPNAPATLKKDKSLGLKRKGIQRVTDTMYNALIPGNPGNVITKIKGGVRIGVGGAGRHPSSPLGIGELSKVLTEGRAYTPPRPVLYPPDADCISGLQRDIILGFKDVERGFPVGIVGGRRFTRGS